MKKEKPKRMLMLLEGFEIDINDVISAEGGKEGNKCRIIFKSRPDVYTSMDFLELHNRFNNQ